MMKRIAIFGGTFNPPHAGHVSAARACVEQLKLNKLIFIPTNIPPHKILPENSASPGQRLDMTAIAASMVPMAEVSDIEIRRKGASYTADTVAEIKALYPESELWLIVGTDMLSTFDRWRRPEDIVSLCRLAAVARGREDARVIRDAAKRLKRLLNARVDIVENSVIEVSSTAFRDGAASELVPPEIKLYIREHGLYGAAR